MFFFSGGCFQRKQLYRLNWCYLYKRFFCSFFLLSSTGCPMSKQEVLFSFAVIISDMLLATLSFRFFLLSSRRHFPHGQGKKKHSAFKQGNQKQAQRCWKSVPRLSCAPVKSKALFYWCIDDCLKELHLLFLTYFLQCTANKIKKALLVERKKGKSIAQRVQRI